MTASTDQRAQQLYEDADRYLGAKSLDEAEASARELCQLLERRPKNTIPTLGDALGILAHIQGLRGYSDEAGQLYLRAIEALQSAPDGGGMSLAQVHRAHAMFFVDKGRFSDAADSLLKASDTLRPLVERLDQIPIEFLLAIAQLAKSQGFAQVAESSLLVGIEALEANSSAAHAHLPYYYSTLSDLYLSVNRAEEAEPAARRVVDLLRAGDCGPRQMSVAMLNLAKMQLAIGRPKETLSSVEEALRWVGDAKEANQDTVFEATYTRGLALQRLGRLGEAENAAKEAVVLGSRAYGRNHRRTLNARESYGGLLLSLGKRLEALRQYEYLAEVFRVGLGWNHPEYADTLAKLARIHDELGQFSEAFSLYKRALKIKRRQLGEADPEVLNLRFNLAELARVLVATNESARRFEKLEVDVREAHGDRTDLYARILTNYGLTLLGSGKDEEASRCLNRAHKLRLEMNGPEHPSYGRVLQALADLHFARQQYDQAGKLYDQARAIYAAANVKARSQVWCQAQHALCRLHLGGGGSAMESLKSASEKLRKLVGELHPDVWHLDQIAAIELTRLGDLDAARGRLESASHNDRILLIDALRGGSETAINQFADLLRQQQLLYVAIILNHGELRPESVRRAFEMVLGAKGAETTALRLRSQLEVSGRAPRLRREIQELKKRLLELELDPGGDDDHVAADFARYRDDLESRESELARTVSLGRLDWKLLVPSAEDVAQGLDGGAALVELVKYADIDSERPDIWPGRLRYAAFVLHSGKPESLQLIDLGSAEAIDDLVNEFRTLVVEQVANHQTYDPPLWLAPGRDLHARLVEPLIPSLGSVERLVVSPDGKLGWLPLGALPAADSSFVVDKFRVSFALSARAFRGFLHDDDLGLGNAAAVFGAPSYDESATTSEPGGEHEFSDIESLLRATGRFQPLKEVEDECRTIAKMLEVEPRMGPDALESHVRDLVFPEMLHIATHGFYIPRPKPSRSGTKIATDDDRLEARGALANPMERSGLAFAGANAFLDGKPLPANADDGILYASEAAGLNLIRTDVVSLSACETGLGDVRMGDGIHGLQRAFITAGARSVVSAMWEVPDKPARALFVEFYRAILDKQPRGDALHQAIQRLKKKYPKHPAAWGGFVIHGETGVLTRFDTARQLTVASITLTPEDVRHMRRKPPRSPAEEAKEHYEKGINLDRIGNHDGAVSEFTKAFSVRDAPEPVKAKALYERAGIYRKTGAFEAALADYEVLAGFPNLFEKLRLAVGFDRGTTYILAGRFDEAIEAYTNVLQSTHLHVDDRAKALINRGGAAMQLERNDEAVADFETVIDTPGMHPQQRAKALVLRGRSLLNSGNAGAAARDAEAALRFVEIMPDDRILARFVHGRAMQAMGRTAEAREDYSSALQLEQLSEQWRQLLEQGLSELEVVEASLKAFRESSSED